MKEQDLNKDIDKVSYMKKKEKKNLIILIIAGVFVVLSTGTSTMFLLQDIFNKVWASPFLLLLIISTIIYLKASFRKW